MNPDVSKEHISDPKKLLALIIGVIFTVELLVGILFGYFVQWPLWLEIGLDALLLVIILFPVLLRFVYRPLAGEIDEQLRIRSLAIETAENTAFITDKNGAIQWVNASFTKLTGYTSVEAIGKTPRILKSGKLHQDFYEHFWKTILAGNPIRSKVIDRRKDGTLFTADQIVTPVKDNHGNVTNFVAIQHDITKDAEIDRAKTEFVSLASHQLRTPLTTIGWYAEMLLSGDAGEITETQKKYLDEIYEGNKRMVELVNNLLNVSRIEMESFGIEPQSVKVKEIVDGVLKDITADVTAKKLHVETTYGDVETVFADPKLLRLIFQNLLTNAVQYTPDGGSIKLTAAKRPTDTQFSVTDTGIGIPNAEREKIFTKLYRADNARRMSTDGNGLGLYMVKSILDHAGGNIWFESEEGKGSTFYVTIPLTGMQKKEGTKNLT